MKKLLAACIGLVMVGLLPSDLLGQTGFGREDREAAQNGWLFDYEEAKAAIIASCSACTTSGSSRKLGA